MFANNLDELISKIRKDVEWSIEEFVDVAIYNPSIDAQISPDEQVINLLTEYITGYLRTQSEDAPYLPYIADIIKLHYPRIARSVYDLTSQYSTIQAVVEQTYDFAGKWSYLIALLLLLVVGSLSGASHISQAIDGGRYGGATETTQIASNAPSKTYMDFLDSSDTARNRDCDVDYTLPTPIPTRARRDCDISYLPPPLAPAPPPRDCDTSYLPPPLAPAPPPRDCDISYTPPAPAPTLPPDCDVEYPILKKDKSRKDIEQIRQSTEMFIDIDVEIHHLVTSGISGLLHELQLIYRIRDRLLDLPLMRNHYLTEDAAFSIIRGVLVSIGGSISKKDKRYRYDKMNIPSYEMDLVLFNEYLRGVPIEWVDAVMVALIAEIDKSNKTGSNRLKKKIRVFITQLLAVSTAEVDRDNILIPSGIGRFIAEMQNPSSIYSQLREIDPSITSTYLSVAWANIRYAQKKDSNGRYYLNLSITDLDRMSIAHLLGLISQAMLNDSSTSDQQKLEAHILAHITGKQARMQNA
jgi:hypothetical protein